MSLEDISPLVWGNYALDHKSSFYGHYSFLKKFGVSTFQGIIDLFVHPYVTFRKIDRDDCFHHSEQTVFGGVWNSYNFQNPFRERKLEGPYCVSTLELESPTRLVHKLKQSDTGATMECVKDFGHYGYEETCKIGDITSYRLYKRVLKRVGQ